MATQIKTPDFDPAAMLCRDCIRVNLDAGSMVELMQAMAQPLARATDIKPDIIAEALVQRERVGTTAFGGGTAVPHARMPHLTRVVGAFATLATPLDLGALDGEPVSVVYALLSPQSAGADHLKALASISRLFRDRALIEKLRGVRDMDAANAMLSAKGWSVAA